MIGAILGGAQVGLGLFDAITGNKEAKRQNRLAEAEAQRLQERQEVNDARVGEQYDRFTRIQDEEEARFNELYRPVEEQLAQDVLAGEDTESRAREAEGDFIGQFDRSLDASRRERQRQGINPNSSSNANFEEEAAFNRARGAATATTSARRAADDENFVRRATFLNSGSGLRDRALRQFGGGLDVNTSLYNIREGRESDAHQQSLAGFAGIGEGIGAFQNSGGFGQFRNDAPGGVKAPSVGIASSQAGKAGLTPRARTGDAAKPNVNYASQEPGGIRSRTTQGVNGAIAAQTRVNP